MCYTTLMHIITVSPISDKIPPQFDRVSFYWRDHLEKGCIVPITFNNRAMRGIVVSSVHVREMKQLIKTSHFTMKKLEMSDTDIIPPSNLTEFIFTIADSTLQAPGKLWVSFLGESSLSFPGEGRGEVCEKENKNLIRPTGTFSWKGEGLAHAYEYTHKKTIVELQQNVPDVIICPTSAFCQLLEQDLEYIPTQTLPKREGFAPDKTIFITPSQLPLFLLEHGHDYEQLTIAVLYTSDTRYIQHEKNPYMDYREIIIPALTHLYSGATTLSLYDPYINIQVQSIFNLEKTNITRSTNTPAMLVSQHTRDTHYSDTMFSRESFTHILDAVSNGKTVQIITARKGVSGSVSCSNCAFIAKCPACNHVQSIVQSNKTHTRNLYCHTCRTKSPVYDMCPQCDGMLAPLGYTTQTIHTSLQSLSVLEHIPMMVIDSDTTKTYKKLCKQLSGFSNGIIITTPAMTDYLPLADLYVIVSFEGLLAHPAYDTDRIVYRLLRTLGNSPLIVQTKNEIIDEIWNSSPDTYTKYESELSHMYHTPPHTTLLTLSKSIPPADMTREIQSIQEFFTHHHDIQYTHTTRGRQKSRTLMVHHHVNYPEVTHPHVVQNILKILTGYSVIKNPRII